jgi:hypothetical protein
VIDPRLAVALAILAVLLALCLPAQAHCFSVWRYPFPQACGDRAPQPRRTFARTPAPVLGVEPSPGPVDIPLTDPDPAMMGLRELLR